MSDSTTLADEGFTSGLPAYSEVAEPARAWSFDVLNDRGFAGVSPAVARRSSLDRSGQDVGRGRPPVPPKPKRQLSAPSSPVLERVDSKQGQSAQSLAGREVASSSQRAVQLGMLVCGASGAGKSSFIKAATGQAVQVDHTSEPCTSHPESFTMTCLDGTRIALIDTPGFNDARQSDMHVLSSILDFVVSSDVKIIAIIYIHRIIDKRITGSTMLNLRMLRAICGEHFYQNVALVTSFWSAVASGSEGAAYQREMDLNTTPGFWVDMLGRNRKGAKYMRWDESPSKHNTSAKRIVEILRWKIDAPALQLKIEVNNGALLEDTTAGQILTEGIRKQQEREEKALEREEAERRALEQEAAALRARMRETQDAIKREAEIAARLAHGHPTRPGSSYDAPGSFVPGSLVTMPAPPMSLRESYGRRDHDLPSSLRGSRQRCDGYGGTDERVTTVHRERIEVREEEVRIQERRPGPSRRDSERRSHVRGFIKYFAAT